MPSKEINDLVRKLEQHGATVVPTGSGHLKATLKGSSVILPSTPGRGRALANAYADVRKRLGVNVKVSHTKRKGTAHDFALERLRQRAMKQMGRGASVTDLARLAVIESDEKHIGAWTTHKSGVMGIGKLLKDAGRLTKPNHDALAAAIGKLESSDDRAFQQHLDKAAEKFGHKRIAHHAVAPAPPEPEAPEPEPEDLGDEIAADAAERESYKTPSKIEVVVRVELAPETRQLLERLLDRG